jgi:hypothetical protein
MSGPFDLGGGRNGPGAGRIQVGPQRPAAAPYRPDVADVDFQAVGDVIVCVLAPPRKSVELRDVSLKVPEKESPFHVVLSVGEKVGERLGVDLEPGDVVFVSGGNRIETLAGSVWFVRAEHVLSVVTRRAAALSPEAQPDAS